MGLLTVLANVISSCRIIGLLAWSLLYCQALKANEIHEVTILTDDSYPPYSYVEDSRLKGIYVDMVLAAADLMKNKYKIKLIAVPWQRALMEVKDGHVLGILPPYQHITERDYIWPYSLPLMSETVVAYCHQDINIYDYFSESTVQVTKPLHVGVNAGYMILGEKIAAAVADNKMVVWENKSTRSNLLKLHLKRIDCYVNDRFSIQSELTKLGKLRDLNFDGVDESFVIMRQTAHIGYTDSDAHDFAFKSDFIYRMDSALAQVKASAQYQGFISKYLSLVKPKVK